MNILYDGWQSIVRAIVAGVLAYFALVLMLRTSGKRTLAKLNAFDLVVTVALGSTLATILLSKDVTVATGVVAFAVLIGMQYAIAALSVHSDTVRRATRSEPRLLVRRGTLLRKAMEEERLTEGEVLQALRNHGQSRVEDVDAVILETDGSLSIVPSASPDARAMRPVPEQDGRA